MSSVAYPSSRSFDAKSLKTRPLAESDTDQLRALLKTRDGADPERVERRLRFVEWIAFHNPSANGEATYLVTEYAGQIVAHLGRMPTFFVVGGEVVRGYFAHDLFVHPELRRRGLGYGLTVSLYKEVEARSPGLVCMLGMTPVNLRIQRRLGYKELVSDRFVKFLDARALSSLVPAPVLFPPFRQLLSATLRAVDAGARRLTPGPGRIIEIERFDARFDALMTRIVHKVGICTLRTFDYLNWKYVDGPFDRRTVLACGDDEEIRGFVVLAVPSGAEATKGFVLDIMADPQDERTVSALCLAALRYFRDQRVHAAHCQVTDPRYVRVFRRHLFFRGRSRPTMTLANVDRLDNRDEILLNIENWHMTHGDSDGFAFGN